jgi:hypothetical protein
LKPAETSAKATGPLAEGIDSLAKLFEHEGESVIASGNRPFLLDGEDNVWFVESGKVEVFAVPLEGKTPGGPRSHFVTAVPGQCIFGMDFQRFQVESGFLAVGAMNTKLRRLSVRRLQHVSEHDFLQDEIAEAIDGWVVGLSRSLTRQVPLGPRANVRLTTDVGIILERGQATKPDRGVVWVEVIEGNLLYVVSLHRHQAGRSSPGYGARP